MHREFVRERETHTHTHIYIEREREIVWEIEEGRCEKQ